jgi:hypothetical protein
MQSVVLILVLIAALLVIASGVWVAAALLRAIARPKTDPDSNSRTERRMDGRQQPDDSPHPRNLHE